MLNKDEVNVYSVLQKYRGLITECRVQDEDNVEIFKFPVQRPEGISEEQHQLALECMKRIHVLDCILDDCSDTIYITTQVERWFGRCKPAIDAWVASASYSTRDSKDILIDCLVGRIRGEVGIAVLKRALKYAL